MRTAFLRQPMTAILAAFACAALSTPAMAADEGSVLFRAFKTFRIDTHAEPAAVQAAAAAAGAQPQMLPPPPAGLRNEAVWVVSLDGQSFKLRNWDMTEPGDLIYGVFHRSCQVLSPAGDDAGVAAARQWAGVAPDATTPNIYEFQVNGDAHTPKPSDPDAYSTTISRGVMWMLMVSPDPDRASLMLIHFVPAGSP